MKIEKVLWNLALNYSERNQASDCWLCLVSRPPYYKGMAISAKYSNSTYLPTECFNLSSPKLSLPEVTRQGLCLSRFCVPLECLCKQNIPVYPGIYYLASPNGTYYVSNRELTPCVSAHVLNSTSDYCVLVHLWPRITYHSSETVLTSLKSTKGIKVSLLAWPLLSCYG